MLNLIVARRPCGCVSAADAMIGPTRSYSAVGLADIGELVVRAIQRGDKITHEHEPVTFGRCDKCRKDPT